MRDTSRGFIGLLTVIVLGALVLATGISIAFIGQTQLVLSGHMDYEHATRVVASACMDEASYRLGLNSAYTGGTVPVGADSCVIAVSGSGATRTVTVTATVGSYVKRVTATATLKQNAAVSASGWSVTAWAEGDAP